MATALSLDPTVTQKRLGDGFYEQRLIREQVSLLTGRRFAGNYTTDEQQYQGLMDGGIAYARAYNLRPGIALTAAQMAVLTTDIVWLVEQTITLADGSQVKALVPQLYVKVQSGDLDGSGTLIAGKDVNINVTGDVTNTGTIAGSVSGSVAGRRLVNITANNLQNLGGRITGDAVTVNARNDLNNIGGQIDAASSLRASAGRDLNVTTTTTSATNQNGANTNSLTRIDRVAGLYVSGQGTTNGGTLVATAGRDINLTAAAIQAQGSILLDAGNNLNLGTVTTASKNTQNRGPNNYLNDATSRDIGTVITATGDSTRNITLSAGNDINARAATVDAQGSLTAIAKRDINLTEGQQSSSTAYAMRTSSSGFLSSSSTQLRTSQDSTTAIGTSLGGNIVTLNAGRDINVRASSVIGETATTALAGNNINLTAGQNTSNQTYSYEKKESGLLSGGGLGISIGKREQSNANNGQGSTAAASTVGAINGNVNLIAGNQFRQVGSDVVSPNGDVNIIARQVDIVEARQTNANQSETRFKQSGLTVSLGGGVISQVQGVVGSVQGALGASGNRNKALNALQAYGQGSNLQDTVGAIQSPAGAGGTDAALSASGVKVSISVGTAKSQSNSNAQIDSAAGSTVKAAGNVTIVATGGSITAQGARIEADKNINLLAADNVNLLASANTSNTTQNSSSSSTNVGISVGVGSQGAGVSLDVSATRGKGQATGSSTTFNNTAVAAGNTLNIGSGKDTNLVGAVASANTINTNVGGNLTIQSLQDTAANAASQSSTGFSASVPIVGSGSGNAGVNISQSRQNANANYQSVNQQSGLQAGSGGYNVSVAGNTNLIGAVIGSTADAANNSLATGSLTTSNLANTSTANATSSGSSIGTGMLDGKYALARGIAGNAMNRGSANSNDNSTTTSAIASGTVTVGGVTTNTANPASAPLKDSNGNTVANASTTASTNRTLARADLGALQGNAQQRQASNVLLFNTTTAFSDEAYKAMFTSGAKMYRIPPGCSSSSCAIAVSADEAARLRTSQDGQVYVSNNGIFNDVDGAIKYAQQHGGVMNADGTKYTTIKPSNQYVIYAAQTNNFVSELLVAGYQKGPTAVLGLTNAEQANTNIIVQNAQQGVGTVFDNHSRGTLTSTNAQTVALGVLGAGGAPAVTVNNYGGAQNLSTGNSTLQQLTGNPNSTINSVIHPQDIVGTVSGGNPATPSYSTTNAATGVTTAVTAINTGQNFVSNAVSIFTGTATPHNCYGTSTNPDCGSFWLSIPSSNTPPIAPTTALAPPTVSLIQTNPPPDWLRSYQLQQQVQNQSNSQMNNLLQRTLPAAPSVTIQPLYYFLNKK